MERVLASSVKKGVLILPFSPGGQPRNSFSADERCVRVSPAPETFYALPHARNLRSVLSVSSRRIAAARTSIIPHAGGAATTLYSGSDSAADSIAPITIFTAAEGKPVQFRDLWDQQNVTRSSHFYCLILKFQNKDVSVDFYPLSLSRPFVLEFQSNAVPRCLINYFLAG